MNDTTINESLKTAVKNGHLALSHYMRLSNQLKTKPRLVAAYETATAVTRADYGYSNDTWPLTLAGHCTCWGTISGPREAEGAVILALNNHPIGSK